MSEKKIVTERLVLVPFTYEIVCSILNKDYESLGKLGYKSSEDWPHPDFFDFLPVLKEQLKELREPSGFGAWIIARKEDMLIIGDAGFKGQPDENGVIDIGYGFVKSQRRKGYGYEAVKALIKWGLEQDNVNKIVADCLIDNIGSIRILQKVGMSEVKRDNEMIYWEMINK
ncbi:GNAT family N-acetyltransferase [Oceanirhabdus sp. W0125-5]|uniref:GNAT family N-acetyltransferase n=1 Tax=Oceanirhabdus sp. W0125-5 TaxID=2999116 RepID=UPI0022F336BB|nr:GNAT family N-acetyltransferase [Oceanirhabdus sp. W0125-5]WBW96962.1 GNAT family N-acetyltransferase [Oceanirhabdus sp. W0125-5]